MDKISELKKMLPAIQNSVEDLRKESATSLCGPCPKCGGIDRFVYRTDEECFWCRKCNPKGGDVIDFHAWIEGTDTKGLIKKYLPDLEPFEHPELGPAVEKYPYTDAKGKVLYYNCRFNPKAFRQCDPTGLKWSVKHIKPKVPYQLPKVIEAKTVFIVEGEKDCHSLAKLNLIGTCNVGGAGNWTPDLNEYFRGKEVFLIADNDDPGRKHVAKVYENLKDIAASIKLIELPGLPEHGDFTNWLEGFADMDEAAERLAIMVENAGPYEPENNEALPRFEFIHNKELIDNLQPIKWQIANIIPENSFYYDFGETGSYKTFVALDRLLCIASGINYHSHTVKQGTAFYIAGEGQQGIGRRIAAWHIEHKTKAKDIPFFVAKTPTQLMDAGAVEDVRKAVDYMAKQYGAPAIVHIDTLARNFGSGDESSTKDMNQVISNLDKAFGNDFCRGLTHHTGHFNKDRARGSYALHAAADSAFKVSLTSCQQVLVECIKMKDAASSQTMLFDLKSILLQIDNKTDQTFVMDLIAEGEDACKIINNEINKVEAVVTALKAMGGKIDSQTHLKNAVMIELNCKEATARRAIKEAVEMKKIIVVPGIGKGSPYGYKLPE